MDEPLLQVRDYWGYHNRYEVVGEWYEHHRKGIFPETMIPPLACIVEEDGVPIFFIACYESVGIGVAFLDWAIARPGNSVRQTSRAAIFGQHALCMAAKEHGYSVMLTSTPPAISGILKSAGYQAIGITESLIKRI